MIDPVCEMQLEEREAVAVSEFHGRVFYFCSSLCKDQFDQDPETFVKRLAHSARS